jgi:5-methylthioadenosine/S-adenosylhomocysteine deaminase
MRDIRRVLSAFVVLLACCLAASAQAPPGRVTIVANGIVITVDSQKRIVDPGSVAIRGRDIAAIGPPADIRRQFPGAAVIDASGMVVMPGLINTHTHAPMVLYRGLADDLALMDWLQKYIFPAEAKTVSPEFVRVGTELAALEMIKSGTTAYADMYYFEEEVAAATRSAGLRGVLGQTIIQFPVADAKTPAEGLARTERFLEQYQRDDLIVPAVAPHAAYTLDTATLQACRRLADKYGAPLLIHLAETEDEVKQIAAREKMSPTAYLEAIGIFSSGRTLAAHGVWIADTDMRALARPTIAVSHNPESNMKLASGAAPVARLQAAGVTVALGTDGAASNNDLDMFEAMRQASFLAKLSGKDPRALPAALVLEMATIDGARALGLDREIGSLEVGKRADLLIVAMNRVRQTPMYDPVSHLVYVTRGDDVQTTIVNGRVLMRNRRVATLAEPAVLAAARRMAEQVRAAVR